MAGRVSEHQAVLDVRLLLELRRSCLQDQGFALCQVVDQEVEMDQSEACGPGHSGARSPTPLWRSMRPSGLITVANDGCSNVTSSPVIVA